MEFIRVKGVNNVTISGNCVNKKWNKTITFVKWKLIHYLINKNMNSTELKGNWEEQKGRLKQKFAALTDNDLMFADGKKEEMFGRLQIKLSKSKEELRKILSNI